MDYFLLSGSTNEPLVEKISAETTLPLCERTIETFSDGETYVNITSNIANSTVFIVQSGAPNANTTLVELLFLIDAARRVGAQHVHVIFPFYPYRRQERQVESGEAIGAAVIAQTIEGFGVDSVTICSPHKDLVADFFSGDIHLLKLRDILVAHLSETVSSSEDDYVIVSPDAGSAQSSAEVAEQLSIPHIKALKYRPQHDVVAFKEIDGDVSGKHVIMIDDEINTGGTCIAITDALLELGAQSASLAVIHPVMSGSAVDRLTHSNIQNIITADTLNVGDGLFKKHTVVSVSKLISEHILTLK